MEHLNRVGGEAAPRVLKPQPMSLGELSSCDADRVIDVREPLAYAAGHLPGSINLPVGMIPAFAGWFVGEGKKLALVASSQDQLSTAMEHLVRIALDNIVGGYVGVVPAAASGKTMRSIPMIGTEEVERRLQEKPGDWTLLDVRDADERKA
jgi:hydroxyacylglutathione hydrolase